MKLSLRTMLVVVLASALGGGEAAAEVERATLELWTRGKGDHVTDEVRRERHQLEVIDLAAVEERELVDPQYDGERQRYRGLPLTALLDRYGRGGSDLALLHFQNGMVIPLPLDPEVMGRASPFLALARWALVDGEGGWRREFPPIEKRGTGMQDRRPIRFQGNKVVVASPWHPMVPKNAEGVFSPWLHADTLTGIELVNAAAYYRQFEVATSELSRRGQKTFYGYCQFCHGSRNIGASFGWDFVEPVALHTYRRPDSLFLHVRYRDGLAPERGLMMPAFKNLGPSDAKALWWWMKDLGSHPLKEYAP